MRGSKRILKVLLLAVLVLSVLCVPAFAITESEVEAQVAASGKEAVAGNLLIWFLCAVAFLKVSQKVDSIMSTLGVNVGRTGGSLLGEAMIAMRAVTTVLGGRRGGAGRAAAGSAGGAGSSGMAGFFKGGLIGMTGRSITNSAVKTATTQTSAIQAGRGRMKQAAADAAVNRAADTAASTLAGATAGAPLQEGVILTGSESPVPVPANDPMPEAPDGTFDDAPLSQEGAVVSDTFIQAPQAGDTVSVNTVSGAAPAEPVTTGVEQHTQVQTDRVQTSHTAVRGVPSLGGMVFSHSLAAGGSFANNVIGSVARGEVAGSITGDLAAQSLTSYMGYASSGIGIRDVPSYSDVEIGRGRITGVETPADGIAGRSFAMYHADQYNAPSGAFEKVASADGTRWYKQYAQDAVERKPYTAPDGTVAYQEKVVKKLPDPPKRKDRI